MRNAIFILTATLLQIGACWTGQVEASNVDYSSLGHVALGGQFSGISLYDSSRPTGPFNSSFQGGLYTKDSNGTYAAIGYSNGEVSTTCLLGYNNSQVIYVGGNFTQIGGVAALNIAAYNLGTNKFSALAGGVLGDINTVYCDNSTGEVYIGGSFEVSNATNVVVWNAAQKKFTTVGFGGFDGPVNTIGSSGASILFGGKFDSISSLNSSSSNVAQQINLQSSYVSMLDKR